MLSVRRIDRSLLSLTRPIWWAGAALLLVLLATPASGQNPIPTTPAVPTPEPAGAASGKLSAKEARDAKIAADAEKLYQMALDLKIDVDKSNRDTVSLSVVKRAAEIEKLAKTLKQEMRAN